LYIVLYVCNTASAVTTQVITSSIIKTICSTGKSISNTFNKILIISEGRNMTKKNENGEFSSIKEENRTNFIPASSMDTLDSTLIVDQTTNDSTSVLADHQSLKERIMASIMNIPDDGEDMHGDGDKGSNSIKINHI
jgi:hypothetical protein